MIDVMIKEFIDDENIINDTFAGAIADYLAMVEAASTEYTKEELTPSILRAEHPELDFMEDDEIAELIERANIWRAMQ